MSARNCNEEGTKIGMRRAQPTADGFGVTYLCDPRSRDCQHGSCWHMSCVRLMVDRWFRVVGPAPRLGWQPPEPPPPFDPSQLPNAEHKAWLAKVEAENAKEAARALVASRRWWDRFHERWGNLPSSAWVWHEPNGLAGGVWPDVDGTGSWGRVVRLVEENR